MAVAIYNEVTLDANSDADATGGWNAGNQDTDSQIEGTACVGAKTGSGITRYFFTNGTTLNFGTGGGAEGRACYVWYNFLTAGFLDTAVNGGVRGFTGSNGATDYEEFTAPQITNGTYFGGWANVVIWPGVADNAGDFNGGTYDNTSVESFGITYNSTSNIMGNFNNGLVDHITIAEGLQATGTGQTFADFEAAEATNIYGIFLTQNGIFFPQGKLVFGDGSTTTVFTSTGETIVFTEQPAGNIAGFYEVAFETGSTATFGNLSSGVTSAGSSFGCASTAQTFVWNVNGTATLNFYASTLDCANAVNLNSSSTFQGSTVSNSGQIDVGGGTINDCVITSSTTGVTSGALAIDSPAEMLNVTNNTFTNNTNAIEITAAGTYDFDALLFSGNSNVVYFSPTSGDLTINLINGTSAISDTIGVDVIFNILNTAGTLTINNNVQVTISGILGNTEVSVLENPSPYTQSLAEQQAGSGPVSLFNEDFVSAVTGTDIEVDTNGTANVIQILSSTTDFTDMTGLIAGDFIRVTERVSGQNLRTFDTFEVVSVTTNTIDVVDVASSTLAQQGIIDTTGGTITVEKINATYSFSVGSGEVVDILLFRVGSLPILLLNQNISSTNNSFPVSQTLDRNFEV